MDTRLAMVAMLMLMPSIGLAAVRVNEVAWMGSNTSATDEWVELYNDGSEAVALQGWMLSALDGSPSIVLSGSIAPGGYYLIERTDDGSVPNIPADLIVSFGNGLSNSGETIRLLDSAATVIEEIVGGENWETLGGDNTTKHTAQRVSGGWVTGTPTPRAANVTPPASPPPPPPASPHTETQDATSSSTQNTSNQGGAVWVSTSPYPRANITAIAPEDLRGAVGATTTFIGDARGMYDELLPYATYRWNFGDGTAGEGKPGTHVYQHSGNYLVVLEVIWGEKRATDRLRVEITKTDAVIVSIGTTTDGVIVIRNTSGHEMDLSGWSLGTPNASTYRFPPNTIVLGGEVITIPLVFTGVLPGAQHVTLSYPGGAIAHQFSQIPVSTPTARISTPPQTHRENVLGTSTSISQVGILSEREAPAARVMFDEEQEASVGFSHSALSWGLLLASLVLVGVFATVYLRTLRPGSEADQYEMIEEFPEEEEMQR